MEHIVMVIEVGENKYKGTCICGWTTRHTIHKYKAAIKADIHVREEKEKEENDRKRL